MKLPPQYRVTVQAEDGQFAVRIWKGPTFLFSLPALYPFMEVAREAGRQAAWAAYEANPGPKPIRSLRELQAAPDELLCTDPQLAVEHKLPVPFWVTRIIWKGGGVVTVEFRSQDERYRPMGGYDWGTTGYTSLKHLFIPDAPPQPGDVPTAGPSWESADEVVDRLLESEDEVPVDKIKGHVAATNPHELYARNALFHVPFDRYAWYGPETISADDPRLPNKTGHFKRDVNRYAKMVAKGSASPPIVVSEEGGRFIVHDGAHRLAAVRQAGVKTILAYIGKPK